MTGWSVDLSVMLASSANGQQPDLMDDEVEDGGIPQDHASIAKYVVLMRTRAALALSITILRASVAPGALGASLATPAGVLGAFKGRKEALEL